jgi:hypothetical protein
MFSTIQQPWSLSGSAASFEERFHDASIWKAEGLAKALAQAQEALRLARESNNADMIGESECALAGLEAFEAARTVAGLRESSLDDSGRRKLAGALNALDDSAATVRSRILEWGERVHSPANEKTGRILDTAFSLWRICDTVRKNVVKLGIADPRPERRLREIGKWSADDFAKRSSAAISMDISSLVPADGGQYQVGFDFIESAYGTDIRRVSLLRNGKEISVSPDAACRVSKDEPWHEMRIDVPPREPNARVVLKVEVSGLPAGVLPPTRHMCSGSIGLRRVGPRQQERTVSN